MNILKNAIAIVMIIFLLSGCMQQPCELCGRWLSDAQRTLLEMENSSLVSDKQRQFFRDNFYGRLVVEIRKNDSRSYFLDESPESAKWQPWQVVSRSGNTLNVQDYVGDELVKRVIRIEGNCYRVDQPNLGFGEWFCSSP